MNILAIDTASEYLSIGVRVGADVGFVLEKVGNLQSELIIPKIQELLKILDVTINDIDAIAYNKGPGSFTGVRVGLSVAIGISLGLNIQLVPIDGFSIIAHSIIGKFNKNTKLVIGIDARLQQIYLAGLKLQNLNYETNPQVVNPEDIIHVLHAQNFMVNSDATGENIVFVGSGFKQYYTQLPELIKKYYVEIDYPNALNMIKLVDSNRYQLVVPALADILYLRNKVALNLAEQKSLR